MKRTEAAHELQADRVALHRARLEDALFATAKAGSQAPQWLSSAALKLQQHYSGIRTTAELQAALNAFGDLGSRPFEIFVVGEGNFGKSTLLNALLGRELSSVHFLPETRAFLRYVASPTPKREARLWARCEPEIHDWISAQLPRATCVSTEIFRASEYQVSVETGERLLKAEAEHARKNRGYRPAILEFEREVEVGEHCPLPAGVRIVDTQGLNQIFPDEVVSTLESQRGATTRERFLDWMRANPRGQHLDWQLRRCDVVLWLAHARKPTSAVTAAALGHFRSYGKETVVVVTHIDQVTGGAESLSAVLAGISESLDTPSESMSRIDGKRALKAALAGDSVELRESGLLSLTDRMTRSVVDNGNRIRLVGAYNSLRRTETQIRRAMLQTIDLFRSLEARLAQERSTIAETSRGVLSEAEASMVLSAGSLREQGHARIAQVGLGDSASYIVGKISPNALANRFLNETDELLDEVGSIIQSIARSSSQEPYALPRFDAEGRQSGWSANIEVLAPIASSARPRFVFVFEVPDLPLQRLVIGLGKLAGVLVKQVARQAEQYEAELIHKRHSLLEQQFDQGWRPFTSSTISDALKSVARSFAELSSAIDRVEASLESFEGEKLQQSRQRLVGQLSAFAAPPALLHNLTAMLGKRASTRWSFPQQRTQASRPSASKHGEQGSRPSTIAETARMLSQQSLPLPTLPGVGVAEARIRAPKRAFFSRFSRLKEKLTGGPPPSRAVVSIGLAAVVVLCIVAVTVAFTSQGDVRRSDATLSPSAATDSSRHDLPSTAGVESSNGGGAPQAAPGAKTSLTETRVQVDEGSQVRAGEASSATDKRGDAVGMSPPTPAPPGTTLSERQHAALRQSVAISWVKIDGGTFQMGSDTDEEDEGPARQVSVPSFSLGRTEVTVAQYRKCVEAGACILSDTCSWHAVPNHKAPASDDKPINCVSWDEAQAFVTWLGDGARLPSEAEWEFAARSRGNGWRYPWGNDIASTTRASMNETEGNAFLAGLSPNSVCSKPSGNSAQGVCDLSGNVWEWVADWYGAYRLAPSDGSARTRRSKSRVVRGGSWRDPADLLRVSKRGGQRPDGHFDHIGFRVARSAR